MSAPKQKTPESISREVASLLREAEDFIEKVKDFFKNYNVDFEKNDFDSLHDEAFLLSKYDEATRDAIKIGVFISHAWIFKSNMKKTKNDIMRFDIRTRAMLQPYTGQIDSLSSELDDILQALTGIKGAVDVRAKFFEKAQYIIFAQKTFV